MIRTTFKFEDGTVKKYEGTNRIHGLRHNGERPNQVVISAMKGYKPSETEKDKLKSFIYRDVIPALTVKHEIGVTPTIADCLDNTTKEMYINFKEQ